MIIDPAAESTGGRTLTGATLAMGEWPIQGVGTEVAPLHVHHEDDEAWHVVSGALRFRFEDRELIAAAGSTVLVPAGVPHTFGNAGPEPSRFIIILPRRLDDLINELHQTEPAAHPAVYRRYQSEQLE